MRYMVHRFSVRVNCGMEDCGELYEDRGFLILPDTYNESGRKTRLVINCHGAGGTVETDDSQVEHQALTQYLAANGYAVMDVNGLPHKFAQEQGIDIRNNIGSPIALRCYVKAYNYCVENFNLHSRVFVHGGSMGGISSTNLVLSGAIPVVAHSAFCPVLDTYNQIFMHPWSEGLPKTALSKIYGFEKDEKGEYIYDERKVSGFNPVRNKKALAYPVPVKFWHCADDGVVSCKITKEFVEAIRESGGMAYLKTFPHGGHEPQLVGDPLENPSGNNIFGDEKIQITPAVEEVFLWIRNFS